MQIVVGFFPAIILAENNFKVLLLPLLHLFRDNRKIQCLLIAKLHSKSFWKNSYKNVNKQWKISQFKKCVVGLYFMIFAAHFLSSVYFKVSPS